MKTRILLVDDHRMFRHALGLLLQAEPDLEVVGQSSDGLQLVELARSTRPDIVCMDIGMPGLNGVEATQALLAELPHIKVLALSTFTEQHYVLDMLRAGASGYVTKAEGSDELLRAIRAVGAGRHYLCPEVAGIVTGALFKRGEAVRPALLSSRERQVLKLVADGFTSLQIGDQLNIAVSTVEVHRRNIMRKLDRHSVAALTRYVVDGERGPR